MLFRSVFLLAASSAAATALSLEEAIRQAWDRDPTAAALALAPELARAREEQAGIRPNPEIEFTGSTPAPFENEGEWSVGIGLRQRLPRRERVERARALARLGAEVVTWQLRERRRRLAGEVRALFYEIAVQRQRRAIAQETLAAQRRLAEALERWHAAGEVGAAQLAVLELESQRAAQALGLAEAELATLREGVRLRLRLPASVSVEADLPLAAVLDRSVPAGPIDWDAARPELALARHAVREAEAGLALARAESRADWTIGAGFEFERRANDFTGRLENDPRLSVGASVPWPRNVPNRGEIREREVRVRLAEAELAALHDTLQLEVATALAALQSLQPVIQAQRELVEGAEPIPAPLLTAYERGELSGLELAQARQQRFAAQLDFLQAAQRYAAALAAAETAVGLVPTPR